MVVGEAASGEGALELAPEAAPDVIVMDVSMPGMGGIAATAHLRRLLPTTAVVMLSLHDDPSPVPTPRRLAPPPSSPSSTRRSFSSRRSGPRTTNAARAAV
jgi:CheY-like chemotaxis protein